jgi:hypothetical protein
MFRSFLLDQGAEMELGAGLNAVVTTAGEARCDGCRGDDGVA